MATATRRTRKTFPVTVTRFTPVAKTVDEHRADYARERAVKFGYVTASVTRAGGGKF
jgi:hypothetical protein